MADANSGTRFYNPRLAEWFKENRAELQRVYSAPVELFEGESPVGLGQLINRAFTAMRADGNASRLVILTSSHVLPRAIGRPTGATYDESEFIGYDNPRAVVENELAPELQGLSYTALNTLHHEGFGTLLGVLSVSIPSRPSGEFQQPEEGREATGTDASAGSSRETG